MNEFKRIWQALKSIFSDERFRASAIAITIVSVIFSSGFDILKDQLKSHIQRSDARIEEFFSESRKMQILVMRFNRLLPANGLNIFQNSAELGRTRDELLESLVLQDQKLRAARRYFPTESQNLVDDYINQIRRASRSLSMADHSDSLIEFVDSILRMISIQERLESARRAAWI